MPLCAGKSLDEWERCLEKRLRGKALIGEVELDECDVEVLGTLLGAELRTPASPGLREPPRTPDQIKFLWQRWPSCMACFTVGVFTYCWEEDNHFWPGLHRLLAVELTPGQQDMWRARFEGYLGRNDLPTFQEVPGQRTIKRVRIHALLPSEAAKRMFEHVVEPAVRKDLPTDELTALEVLQILEAGQPTLHKPEGDFLRYGGHVADDVLRRCVQLYSTAAGGPVVDHFHLPQRIVDAFDEWWQNRGRHAPPPPGKRMAGPYLRMSEWGDVVMVLPPRSAPETATALMVEVRRLGIAGTDASSRVAELRVGIDRRDGLTREVDDLCVPGPAREYAIRWYEERGPADEELASGEELCVKALWVGEDTGVPWMAFTQDDLRRVPSRFLPRGEVWLVSPGSAQVLGLASGHDGDAQPLEPVDELRLADWAGYVARLIDTEGLFLVRLQEESGPSTTVPVDKTPRLLGEPVPGVRSEGLPVYASPPRCEEADGAGFRAYIEYPRGSAPPDVVPAEELPQALQNKVGAVRITVRGRLGRSSRPHDLVLVPGLEVRFGEDLYAPVSRERDRPFRDNHGIRVRLTAQGIRRFECEEAEARTTRQDDSYAVTLPADAQRFNVRVVLQVGAGTICVPLQITAPRVLVGLGGPRLQQSQVGVDRVEIQTSDLQRKQDVLLWLAVEPRPAGKWDVEVRAEPAGWKLGGNRRGPKVTVDIRAWLDGIKCLRDNQELWADVQVDGLRRSVPIGRLVLMPTLKKVKLEAGLRRQILRYSLDGPEVDAMLRLSCLRYPWIEPMVLPLRKGLKGEVQLPRLLPPGKCLCEVISAAPEEQDLLPDAIRGLVFDMPPAIDSSPLARDDIEQFLRKMADTWAEAWQFAEDKHRFAFNPSGAQRADAEARKIRCRDLAPPVCEQSFRYAVVLMLWWLRQAEYSEQQVSSTYARWAVRMLTEQLCRVCGGKQALMDALTWAREKAGPHTIGLWRELDQLIQRLAGLLAKEKGKP